MDKKEIPHILVVDDEPDVEALFRQKFRRMIRNDILRFTFARDGMEGLECLHKHNDIELVFTDLNMPRMDGMEFLGKMRAIEGRHLKAVVISAYGDMANIRQAMNRGAMDFVIKPIDLKDLEATLEKGLEEVKTIREGAAAARALQTARREKEIVERSRLLQKQFFDNVTHELRTPLTLLLGPLDSAMQLSKDSDVQRQLHIADRNGRQLLDLIDELLQVARIDAGTLTLSPIQADIATFLRELCENFQSLAAARQLNLRYEGPENPLVLDFDPEKFRKIMVNLLSNALKFTPQGGEVTVTVEPKGSILVLTVRDSGRGIPEAALAKVFERFYRAQTGEKQVVGTGIGLSLVRDLVELHGGEIDVASEVGKGTVFKLRLPVRNEAEPGEVQGTVQHRRPLVRPVEQAEPAEDAPLVLVVEDHPDMREHIRDALGSGFRTILAEDGAAGLAQAQQAIPDIVVTDVTMPEMDGFELCQALKTDRATSHIPVVMLTARAEAESRLEGLQTGADAYLSKPFNQVELQTVLQNLLRTQQALRDQLQQKMFVKPEAKAQLSMEEQFVKSCRDLMEIHLANEFFGVEQMATEMGMSRKTLHRKLTALTGQTPNQFIRNFRLEAAMQMLQNKSGPVGEIAFLTGFSSHSYFSKCFMEYFKRSPSEI
ncbi:MAG: response regulator [Bacteroidota bacterium]